ncbi:hypothetical protein [Anaeromyxobacter diazotrophicus]|uniref:Uncharacterized protein n=1 Tax=Anaeromyxobacter diazotrophicus TaxID=2590199 RepID=A0A7I9VRE9_9BACT|nr:hypothetical protein [Anaeromyxobacter diazotrophicus]GEJ59006.1 hypothetical protein AMYX_37470 [Anaeromyxobacter diazotrophicus]
MAHRALLALLAAAGLAGPVPGEALCPAEAPVLEPAGGLAPLTRLRDAFAQRAARAGAPLRAVPALREATGPRLLAWNAATGEVEVPRWEELPEAERSLLARMAGSPARAPGLFAWLYRWFYLPRALSEALLAGRGGLALPDARLADDLGVAFLAAEPMGPERLARLRALVDEALGRLATELGDPAAAARRDELGRLREALARRGERSFEALLALRAAPPGAGGP